MRPFLRHAGVWARAGGFMRALSGQVEVEEERGQPMLLDDISMKGIRLHGAPLYLDMQSTTPLDPRVLDRMMPWMLDNFGNPHSRTHLYGWEAEDAVEKARAQVRRGLARARRSGREGRVMTHVRPLSRADRGAGELQPQGDCLHLWRDRVEQRRAQGRRFVLRGEEATHHHRADGAQGEEGPAGPPAAVAIDAS